MSIINTTFEIISHGKKFPFNTAEWDESVLINIIQAGIKIRLDRSSASITKKAGYTQNERLKACEKTATNIQNGIIPKSGGSGSRTTPEQRALKATLKTLLTFESKETLENALIRYTKELAKSQDKDFDPTMLTKVQQYLEELPIYQSFLESERNKSIKSDILISL